MATPDKREQLYKSLIGTGKVTEAEIGNLDEFRNAITDEASARQFHKNLLGSGIFDESEIGNADDFYGSISSDFDAGVATPSTDVTTPSPSSKLRQAVGRNVAEGVKQVTKKESLSFGASLPTWNDVKNKGMNFGGNNPYMTRKPLIAQPKLKDTTKVDTGFQTYVDNEGNFVGSKFVGQEGTPVQKFVKYQDKKAEEERNRPFDDRVSDVFDKYGAGSEAEEVWNEAEAQSNKEFGNYLEKQGKPTFGNVVRELAGASNVTGGAGVDALEMGVEAFASHLKYHDLQKLSDAAWDRMSDEKKYSIVTDIYRKLQEYYPDSDKDALMSEAMNIARQQSDKRVYDLAVKKNTPKDALDLFFRKAALGTSIGDLMMAGARAKAGTIGDMAAREEAEQQYEKEHKLAGVAGTVAGFTIDPLVYAGGAIGSAGAKGGMWLGGKMFGRAAARKFGTTLGVRIASGAVGGGLNFGAYEAGREATGQLKWGGHRNPKTGEIEDYSLGEVGKRFGHGLMMGAATGVISPMLGNISDKLVRATKSTAGKMAYRAGELGVGTVAEGTIFSVPEAVQTYSDYTELINSLSDENSPNYIADDAERAAKIKELTSSRNDAILDVWTDNMIMMAGFKANHLLKSAPRVIQELSQNPTRSKAGFETRLRKMLDGQEGLALTKDEKFELNRAGYDDLSSLVESYEYFAKKPERAVNEKENSIAPFREGIPYNRFVELMQDTSISEAARAKMYYYLTGNVLPMSTITGVNFRENKDQDDNVVSYTVESFGNNGVVTSRTFDSRDRANVELDNVKRQVELNTIDIGERYYKYGDKNISNNRMFNAAKKVADDIGYDIEQVQEMMSEKPENLTIMEKRIVDLVQKEYDRMGEESLTKMRDDVNKKYGVDVDQAVGKEPNRRSEQEKKAVEEYTQTLYTLMERGQQWEQKAEDMTRLIEGTIQESVTQEHTPEDLHEGAMNENDAAVELMKTADGRNIKAWIDEVIERGTIDEMLTEDVLAALDEGTAALANRYAKAKAKNKGVDIQTGNNVAAAVATERQRLTPFIRHDALDREYFQAALYKGQKGYITNVSEDGAEVSVLMEGESEPQIISANDEDLTMFAPALLDDYMADYEKQVAAQMANEVENARVNNPKTNTLPQVGDVISTPDGQQRVAVVTDDYRVLLEPDEYKIDENTGQQVPIHINRFSGSDLIPYEKFVGMQNEYWDAQDKMAREEEAAVEDAKEEVPAKELETAEEAAQEVKEEKGATTKIRGRRQVQKGIEKLREAQEKGDVKESINQLFNIKKNVERGDEGAITPEEQAYIDEISQEISSDGYEVIDYEGQEYTEGLKVTGDFLNDPSLPLGTRIIKNVNKPAIIKDGKIVQAADIIVAQNLGQNEIENLEVEKIGLQNDIKRLQRLPESEVKKRKIAEAEAQIAKIDEQIKEAEAKEAEEPKTEEANTTPVEEAPVDEVKNADDEIVERMLAKDEKVSGRFIKNNLEAVKKELEKARKKESKATDLDTFERETAEFDAEVARLEGELARWENIEKRVREGRLEGQREVADAAIANKKVSQLGEPLSLREWVMRALYERGYKFIWGDDNKSATKGLGSHLGLKDSAAERRSRLWMTASREKGGLYPEEMAERMLSSYATDMGWEGTEGDWNVTSQDVLDILLDVANSYGRQSTLGNAILEEHAKAESAMGEGAVSAEEEEHQMDMWAKDGGFNSYAEYEDYLDMVEHSVEPYTEEEYEQNKIDIAERYEEEFVSLQQKEQLNTQDNGETNVQPSEAGVQGRNGLLPEEGSGEARGIEGGTDEQREDASLHNQGAGTVSQGEGAGQSVSVAQSEQLKPTDLRDAVKPDSAELGADEAKAKANGLFEYFKGTIKELINEAKKKGNDLVKKIIAPVSSRLKDELASKGVDVEGYNHVLDNSAIRHTFKQHGSEQELNRGQIPITDEDFERIPDVVENYDDVNVETGKRGEDNIVYSKSYPDGTTIFVEEKRDKRRELAAVTMWKMKNTTLTDANRSATPISDLSGNVSNEIPNESTDSTLGSPVSEGKGTTKSKTKQEKEEKFFNIDDIEELKDAPIYVRHTIEDDAVSAYNNALLEVPLFQFGVPEEQQKRMTYEAFEEKFKDAVGNSLFKRSQPYLHAVYDYITKKLDDVRAERKKQNEPLSETDPVKRAQQIAEREKGSDAYAGMLSEPEMNEQPVVSQFTQYERDNAEGTVNKQGGLAKNELSDSILSESWRGALHVLGRNIGRRIVILSGEDIRKRFGNGVQGFYDKSDNTLYLNEDYVKDNENLRNFVLGHEMTHILKSENPEVWNAYVGTVKAAMGKEFQKEFDKKRERYDAFIEKYNKTHSRKLRKLSDAEIEEEVCSDWAGRNVLTDEESVKKIIADAEKAGADPVSLTKRILDAINQWLAQLKQALKNAVGKADEIADNIKFAEQAKKLWQDMYNVAVARRNQLKKSVETEMKGSEVDAEKGDVRFAVADILEGKVLDKTVKDLMAVTGRSEKVVRKWLKAEQSLAKIINDNDNKALLDLEVDESVPAIWNNSDYPQGTVEFSNICRKRLPLTTIYQRLQKEYPNTVFDAATLESIRGALKDKGIDVACGLCFVEDRRQLLGEIGKDFINAVQGKQGKTESGNEKQQKAIDRLKKSGDNYVPTLYDLLTLDGMKKLRKEHPSVAQAFVEFNNARGMQAGRLFEAYSAYHRDILKWNKSKVNAVNSNGGLRIFSFSDFEAHHLIDLVQVLTDCASKGVMVQGYTKVPEFAKSVMSTKMKLSRSLAKGEGYVDADYNPKDNEAVSPNVINGKRLLLDCVEGIDVNHPDFFDSSRNHDVGNILVGINDEQIRMAMADPFIDYIIPFHSGLSEAIRKQKGIGTWKNYKLSQLEKMHNENGKLVNADKHGINIYTDVLPRGEQLIGREIRNRRDFQEAFFAACAEKGWVPRFADFINKNKKGEYVYTPGYEKLLIDFKLFDNNGRIIMQEPVVPVFDDAFNAKILDDYVKDEKAKTDESMEEVYNDIVERLGLASTPEEEEADIKFSLVYDPIEVARLESEPKEVGYRNVVLNEDGTLGSPMADKLGKKGEKSKRTSPFEMGRWEKADEHPELANENGKIDLVKPDNKKVGGVDYNPYIHIRPDKVNKQFKQAWERPNLVYVETMYPTSELTSGYQAEKAKKSVGLHDWNGGKLILSRWDKPVRIVPWEEVADDWVKEFKDRGVEFDIVPPAMLPILSERGVEILPPHKGMGKECVEAYKEYLAGKQQGAGEVKFSLEEVNSKFNSELDKQINGTLPIGHVYNMGMPGDILKSTGVANVPIQMNAARLADKSSRFGHNFDLSEIKDLVKAINSPVAVFSYGDKRKAQNIIVNIQKDGKNFVVGLSIRPNVNRKVLEINSIRNVFPKKNAEWLNWVNQGKLLYVDKEKIQTLIDQQRTILADVDYLDLDSVAKVIQDFENPKLSGEKISEEPKFSLADEESRELNRESEESKHIFDTAKRIFGSTTDIREAGYILPDGTMLDFSGRHLMNEGSDTSFLRGRRTSDHRDIQSIAYERDGDTETGVETDMPDFIRRGAIRIDDNAGTINLYMKPTDAQKAVLRRLIARNDGDVSVDFGDGWDSEHYVDYAGAKPVRVMSDIDKYFDEGIKPEDDIRFSLADEEPFYSNAEKAVESIKQEKATPEQWLKMIEKNGGLKAGEDKWMGLSDWLKENKSKTLTKDEVMDYIRKNEIQIEEVNYGELSNVDDNEKMKEFRKEFDELVAKYNAEKDAVEEEANAFNDEMYEKYGQGWANDPDRMSEEDQQRNDEMVERWDRLNEGNAEAMAFSEMADEYGDDFREAFELDYGGDKLQPIRDWDGLLTDAARYFLDINDKPINSTRMNYTTEGLDNKREIALVVPSIESWGAGDEIHFGDAGEGRAVAWVRFGETRAPRKEKLIKTVTEFEEPYKSTNGRDVYMPKGEGNGKDYVVYGKVRDGRMLYVPFMREQIQVGGYDTLEEARQAMNAWYKENNVGKTQYDKVLVIDEIQSKRHQEGREKGYANVAHNNKVDKLWKKLSWDMTLSDEEADEIESLMNRPFVDGEVHMPAEKTWLEIEEDGDAYTTQFAGKTYTLSKNLADSKEEAANILANEINKEVSEHYKEIPNAIPDAPFDKNWHELAMKRMLRYAAENGYDKIAWTKGEQQAERYNIGNVVSSIDVTPYEAQSPSESDGHDLVMTLNDGTMHEMFVQPDGTLNADSEMFDGKKASEVFGKGIAERIMSANEPTEISGDGLRIGGEGMKGFYDQILPRFMDKYGKKWGVKTGEVELPNLEESAQKMWSVDVTPEMKESVMQGQPMFSLADEPLDEYDPVRRAEQIVNRDTMQRVVDFFKGAKDDALKLWNDGQYKLAGRLFKDVYGVDNVVVTDRSTVEDLVKKGFKMSDARDLVKEMHEGDGENLAIYSPKSDKIAIFARNKASLKDIRSTLLHEYAHQFVEHLEDKDAMLNRFWKEFVGRAPKLWDGIKDEYGRPMWENEFFAYVIGAMANKSMLKAKYWSVENMSESARDVVLDYLNSINYGRNSIAKRLYGLLSGKWSLPKDEASLRQLIESSSPDGAGKRGGGTSGEGVGLGETAQKDGSLLRPSNRQEAEIEPKFSLDEGEPEEVLDFDNILTKATLETAESNKESLNSKIDAIERVVQQLEEKMRKMKEGMHESPVARGAVRTAAHTQKTYDRSTVMDFVEFAKVVMDAGTFDSASKGEVKRLMNLTKGVVGKEQLEQSLNAVADLIIDHSIRESKNLLKKQLSTKGTKVDAKGVEVQGKLDIEGQRVMAALKDGMKLDKESLQTRLADAIDRMGSDNEVVANNAASEYQGLMLAKQYLEEIKDSEAEESTLKHEFQLIKDSLKEGEIDRQSFKEFEESFHENIRQIKMERIKAYENLVSAVGGNIARSFEEAKAFKEAEMERIKAIQHNANSDLTGTPATTQSELPWYSKLANAGLVRFFMQPVATFDEMLRFLGKKSADGRGYLWNRFMSGWTKATENLWKSTKEAHDELDKKVKEIFAEGTYIGKDGKEHKFPKIQRWSDLFSLERKMEGADVEYWDDGKKTYHLSEGKLLYIYMVDKMSDGKMKLRKMGITEEDVDAIKEHLNPSFIKLADWIQNEFLPKRRVKYNEVYKRMFGADMAAIDNYFPLKIDKKALNKEEDLSAYDGRSDINPATITGSVIKRTKNASALDLMHADAFDLVLSHLDDMERWAAFAEFNRDLNTLLSYKRFRNQLQNMSSGRFGAGDTLLENFKTVAAIAGGAYRPHVRKDSVDSTMVNLAKGVTAAKISLRVYTAFKQLLSYPAYLSEANLMELVKSSNPVGAYKAWNWAMENLPLYAERWQSRQAGDYRLKETDMDWQMWKNDLVRTAARVGMSPNAFVDALTVAMGAKAVYETARKRYLKDGFDAETAKEKAMLDASVAYNETQQSSQSAYMSAMQLDRTAASVALTVFRNASMAYQRRMLRALSNMKKRMNPDYKDESIGFMQKMLEREGVNEEEAKKASERMYRRQVWRDMVDVAVFGYILQAAWNLAPYLPYLIAGDDDDEKEKMLEDALRHAMFGGIEGLTGGSLMSEVGNLAWQIAAEDDDKKVQSLKQRARYQDFNLLPLMSDLQSVMNKSLTGDKSALVDGVNLLLQSGIGVNPQTFSDAVVATIDAFNGDLGAWKEFAYAVARIMQTPSGAMDMLYIDELGMFAHDARKLRMEDLAKRWARYKMMKDNPLLGWAYSEEEEKKLEEKLIKRFENKVKERIADMDDEEVERMMIQSRPGMEQKMLEKEMNKRYQKEADELDGEELDDAFDNAVLMPERKVLSKDIAKEVGASRDSYGAKPQNEHEALYQDLRTADDVREDAQLLKMQEDAKNAGDEQRKKYISEQRSKVMSARKGLGMGNDDEVMQRIRENRKKLIERLEKK